MEGRVLHTLGHCETTGDPRWLEEIQTRVFSFMRGIQLAPLEGRSVPTLLRTSAVRLRVVTARMCDMALWEVAALDPRSSCHHTLSHRCSDFKGPVLPPCVLGRPTASPALRHLLTLVHLHPLLTAFSALVSLPSLRFHSIPTVGGGIQVRHL